MASTENAYWNPPLWSSAISVAMLTMRLASGTGSGWSAALTRPKSAELAPSPIASVRTAAAVNDRCRQSNRRA